MFIAFRLKEGRDDAIINWIENLGEYDRSYSIRKALKTYLERPVNAQQPVSFSASSKDIPIGEFPEKVSVINDEDLEKKLGDWLETV